MASDSTKYPLLVDQLCFPVNARPTAPSSSDYERRAISEKQYFLSVHKNHTHPRCSLWSCKNFVHLSLFLSKRWRRGADWLKIYDRRRHDWWNAARWNIVLKLEGIGNKLVEQRMVTRMTWRSWFNCEWLKNSAARLKKRNFKVCDRKIKLEFNYFDNTNIIIVNFVSTANFINPFIRVAHKIPRLRTFHRLTWVFT